MKVLHDGGGGVTDISKKYFLRYVSRLGRVYEVNIHNRGEFTFEIQASNGIMLLSGFACGYPGTGSAGAVWCLEQLGVPKPLAEVVYQEKHLTFDLRGNPQILNL